MGLRCKECGQIPVEKHWVRYVEETWGHETLWTFVPVDVGIFCAPVCLARYLDRVHGGIQEVSDGQ
jgi:hypothetical protein